MPVFILFVSLILASVVGIILDSFFNVNGTSPDWVHNIFLSIIGTGVIAAAITKEQLCKLCSFTAIKKLKFCQCQHV